MAHTGVLGHEYDRSHTGSCRWSSSMTAIDQRALVGFFRRVGGGDATTFRWPKVTCEAAEWPQMDCRRGRRG